MRGVFSVGDVKSPRDGKGRFGQTWLFLFQADVGRFVRVDFEEHHAFLLAYFLLTVVDGMSE